MKKGQISKLIIPVLHLETSNEGQSTNMSSSNASGTRISESSFGSPNFMFEPIVMQSLPPHHAFAADDLQISDLMKADLEEHDLIIDTLLNAGSLC